MTKDKLKTHISVEPPQNHEILSPWFLFEKRPRLMTVKLASSMTRLTRQLLCVPKDFFFANRKLCDNLH